MKRLTLSLLTFLAAIATLSAPAEAGCWCWQSWYWEYCTGNSWTDTPGTTVVTYTYGVSSTDAKNNGGCTYAGETPPTKVCDVDGGLVNVKEWEITGEISDTNWGVSGTVGETISVSLSCGGPVTISSFCQCCKTRARIKYKNTYKCGTCECSLAGVFACFDSYCGTKIEYEGVECDEPGCTVPPECDPECPDS